MTMIIQTTLTSNNARYKSTLEPALKLYKGDIVFVEITLINTIISSINGQEVEDSIPMSQLSDVKMKLKTPAGTETIDSIDIVDNKAKFKLHVTEEVGEYPFYLICYDSDGCVFRTVPTKYTIEDIL